MTDLQINNERFNNAVNWLKQEGKVKTLYSLADKLEVSRKEFDRFRNGSKKVSMETVEKLLSNFAECRSFFENESAKKKDILGLLIDTQKKLIEKSEKENKELMDKIKNLEELRERANQLLKEKGFIERV